MVASLNLQRDELARLLGNDFKAVRQFEKLFSVVDEIGPQGYEDILQLLQFASASMQSSEPENHVQFSAMPSAPNDLKLRVRQPDNALAYGLSGLEIGLGFDKILYVQNASGASITRGSPVKINGVASGLPSVAPANNTAAVIVAGVAMATIANGASGYMLSGGMLRDIDATGAPYGQTWSAGQTIYVNATGGLTNVAPTAPAYEAVVGVVVDAVASGQLWINPSQALGLNSLNDVHVTAPTASQTLMWDATAGIWTQGNLTAGVGVAIAKTAGAATFSLSDVTNNQTVLMRSSVTLANSAAASLATLTNSPVVGDPTKWVDVDDNGTIRKLPLW